LRAIAANNSHVAAPALSARRSNLLSRFISLTALTSQSCGEALRFGVVSSQHDGHFYVYLLTNYDDSVIYTGMTNNLLRRVQQHKEKLADGFTKRYNVSKLVYYERADSLESAYTREQAIKGGSRKRKEQLIASMNSEWRDLYGELMAGREPHQGQVR
jgi:putative endonuclease